MMISAGWHAYDCTSFGWVVCGPDYVFFERIACLQTLDVARLQTLDILLVLHASIFQMVQCN